MGADGVKIFDVNEVAEIFADHVEGNLFQTDVFITSVFFCVKVAVHVTVGANVVGKPIFALPSEGALDQNGVNVLHHILKYVFVAKVRLGKNVAVPKAEIIVGDGIVGRLLSLGFHVLDDAVGDQGFQVFIAFVVWVAQECGQLGNSTFSHGNSVEQGVVAFGCAEIFFDNPFRKMTEIGIGLQEPFQIYLKGKRWIVQSDEACNAAGDGMDANQFLVGQLREKLFDLTEMQGREIPLAVIVLNEHENRSVRIAVKMLHNGGVNFGVGFAMRIEKDGT